MLFYMQIYDSTHSVFAKCIFLAFERQACLLFVLSPSQNATKWGKNHVIDMCARSICRKSVLVVEIKCFHNFGPVKSCCLCEHQHHSSLLWTTEWSVVEKVSSNKRLISLNMATSAGQRKRSICMVEKRMFNTKVHFEMLVFERHER